MIFLLDSSVLVAAMVESHADHLRCLPLLQSARPASCRIAAHSIAETFSVLTRLPLRPRIAPAVAETLVTTNVLGRARLVPLDAKDHVAVLRRMAELGLGGGATYDALILRAAEKARVDRVYTLNLEDFRRLWPDAGERLAAP